MDAAGYTPGIAAGGVFVVKGSHLSPDGAFQASGYPLTTTLNGVSLALSPAAGGAGIPAYLISAYNSGGTSQLAALLPSTVAPGSYNLTVTSNGVTSAAVGVTVAARKFNLFTADSTGSGAAALQVVDWNGNYHYNRFTTQTISGNAVSPAHPGDFVVAYGTGLGAIQLPDQSPPGALDLRAQVSIQVLIGGEAVTPLYAGRSPDYPGIDQVNFQLPADVATGCVQTIQVSVNGSLSNAANISIAPAGSDTCSPAPVSNDILSRLDQGGAFTVGNFWLTQLSPTPGQPLAGGLGNVNESAYGGFVKYTGNQLASAAALLNPTGSCQVLRVVGNSGQLVFGPVGAYLNAGQLILTGPGVANRPFTVDTSTGIYSLPLGATSSSTSSVHLPIGFSSFNAAPSVSPGTYQLIGNGGGDIGIFSASMTFGQPLAIQGGLPLSIARTSDLTLSWTGGNPGDVVSVTGISGTMIGGTSATPIYNAAKFTCSTTAGAGSITVPSSLLMQLPASGTNGIGYLSVTSGPQPVAGNGLFTAPLTAGGTTDAGFFLGALGLFGTTSYQ